MKGDIRKALQAVAETTPQIFDWVEHPEEFTGEELLLTPIAQQRKIVKGQTYIIDMPALRAVDHYAKFVEAFNNMGWQGVKKYHRSVMDKIKQHGIKVLAASV